MTITDLGYGIHCNCCLGSGQREEEGEDGGEACGAHLCDGLVESLEVEELEKVEDLSD